MEKYFSLCDGVSVCMCAFKGQHLSVLPICNVAHNTMLPTWKRNKGKIWRKEMSVSASSCRPVSSSSKRGVFAGDCTQRANNTVFCSWLYFLFDN